MTRTMTFTATAQARPRGGIAIALPFDPAEAWGDRDRYYLAGTIEHYRMRATVTPGDPEPTLVLGPAWCRDPRVGPGATLRVSLQPEGPQLDTIARNQRHDASSSRWRRSIGRASSPGSRGRSGPTRERAESPRRSTT
jgi:hypothetical protein